MIEAYSYAVDFGRPTAGVQVAGVGGRPLCVVAHANHVPPRYPVSPPLQAGMQEHYTTMMTTCRPTNPPRLPQRLPCRYKDPDYDVTPNRCTKINQHMLGAHVA